MMGRRLTILFPLALAALAEAGCDSVAALAGGAGLPCLGPEACPPGLACVDGTCRAGDAGAAREDAGGQLPVVRRATSIAVHNAHSCALLEGGALKCWGGNWRGQLGLGDERARGNGPGEMGDALPAVDLGATALQRVVPGHEHSCALTAVGQVKCWGENDMGQLGVGDAEHRGDEPGEMGSQLAAVDLGSGRRALSLAAGGAHTCAILDSGVVKCWGWNMQGQLGLGDIGCRGTAVDDLGDRLPPVALGAGGAPLVLAAGAAFTCVLRQGGEVKCWGDGSFGELGTGDSVRRGDEPDEMGDSLPPVELGAGRHAVSISAGFFFACALLDDGAVRCWGENSFGQLGLGDSEARGDEPGEMGDALPQVSLGAGNIAVAITAGSQHCCALLDGGEVKCWGDNSRGQLGLGDREHRGDEPGEMGDALPAVDLGPARRAVALSAGGAHTCALLDDGAVKCWGRSLHGQLGLGDDVTHGDEPGEMGQALPRVDLGTAQDEGTSP